MTSADHRPDALPAPCPCASGKSYAACCSRWHTGTLRLQAPDAEQFMRSRYSAYVLGLHDYLLDSWHPRTRPSALPPDPPDLRWLGLEVRRHVQLDADHAIVEFVARAKRAGKANRMHETSRFERLSSVWLYLDAQEQITQGVVRRPTPGSPPAKHSGRQNRRH